MIEQPRLPRWMIEQEIREVQDRLDEAIAVRDGLRLASAANRRTIIHKIERYDAELSRLHALLWFEGGQECRVAHCLDRVDDHRAFETTGLCESHYLFVRGLGPEPPLPDIQAPSIGSPFGDYLPHDNDERNDDT